MLLTAVVFVWAPLLPMRVVLHLLSPVWRKLGDVSIAVSLGRSPAALGLLLLALAVDPLIAMREEKELVERMGTDYVEYRKRVPRLLPRFQKSR